MAVPSFPQVHVTGVVHHYVRPFGSAAIWYLGTAEVTPQMQVRAYTSKVMNDNAGKTLPFQKTRDGEAATVSSLFTVFSKGAVNALKTRGVGAGYTTAAGNETRWSRGQLVYGWDTVELWQVYDNFFNPFGSSTGLEIGWYWPQVEILQLDTVKAGTQGEGQLCVFDCTPAYNPLNRGWMLYSHDEDFFPGDVRVPQ